MDPQRIPVALPQSETVHASAEGTAGNMQPNPFGPSNPNVSRRTDRIDSGNLSSYDGNVLSDSPSSEKMEIQSPLPARLPESNPGRRETRINSERFPNALNTIDWIVPTEEAEGKLTVGERLQPTLDTAILEKEKSTAKAKWTGIALNVAIGMQVLLGSLTTGLSALAVSGGKSTAAATTALGALATLVASYLARARGSNEPEVSITRTKALDQLIRECQAFQMDYGHLQGRQYDPPIIQLRRRLEEILSNGNSDRDRKPPPPT